MSTVPAEFDGSQVEKDLKINLNCVEEQVKQTSQFSLALLLSILAIGLIASLGWMLLSHFTNMAHFAKERYVYASCLLMLLPLCFACMRVSDYISSRWDQNKLFNNSLAIGILSLWITFWLTAIPTIVRFLRKEFIFCLKPVLHSPFKHPLFMLKLFVFMAFIGCIGALSNWIVKMNVEATYKQRLFWLVVVIVSAVLVGSQNISGLSAVTIEAFRWENNFEPVLYPISQVLAGKTLLVDLPSQYGLYPELIAPIFKLVRFSISKITFLFALMEGVSYFALAFVFFKITKSSLFRVFWLLSTAILFAFSFQNYASYETGFDPYNQYYPIRLFFPAVSVLLFWWFISIKPSVRNAVFFSVFLACGVIWNLDSGVPALGSFLAFLILSAFFAKKIERTQWIKVFTGALLGAVITFALFAIYMTLKAGVLVPWGEWLHYQRVFYVLGFGSIPLPTTPHPWMAVIVVYIIGILGYMRFASRNSSDHFWQLMLYLSVLGLGLFAYYQHNSHDVVFLAACWPALLMSYTGCERFIRYIITSGLPKLWILAVLPTFIVGASFCGFFAYKLPHMIGQAKYNWRMAFKHKETYVTENISFMRARIPNQDRHSIEIISHLQAIYFAQLGIASAIKGPGTGGAMPGEDQIALLKRLRAAKPRILFLQKGLMPLLEEEVRKEYKLVDENNQLMHFRAS